MKGLNFGKAIQILNTDKLVRRAEWHPDAWLMRVDEFTYPTAPWNPYARAFAYLGKATRYVTVNARLDFFDGEVFHVGWSPGPEDFFSQTWELIEGEGTVARPKQWEYNANGYLIPKGMDTSHPYFPQSPPEGISHE